MATDAKTGAAAPRYGPEQLIGLDDRITQFGTIQQFELCNLDSTEMEPTHWSSLVDAISYRYDEFDSFVITTGTNTLSYLSSAISFALQGIGKPVLVTGSQIPAEKPHSDARSNFVNALRVCSEDLSGVFVVFGSKIIRGCRAKKMSESELDAFASFNSRNFADIGVKIVFREKAPRHARPFQAINGFENRVCSLTLVPGMSSEVFRVLIDGGMRGIILRAFGSGDVPTALVPGLRYAREHEVPVIVTTQCPHGVTSLGINAVSYASLDEGVVEAFDMSMEAMTTKLMWLLHQAVPYEKLRELMQDNLVGEIYPSHT